MPDHIHLCLSIPPKFSVVYTVGFLKGKSAVRIHREFLGQKRNFTRLPENLSDQARSPAMGKLGYVENP